MIFTMNLQEDVNMDCFGRIGNYHEMNIDWLICELKKALEAWDKTSTEWANMKEWIENYFKNLNLDQQIQEKIDALVEDGTIERIINEEIFGELNTKVEKNTQDIATANQAIAENKQDITSANQKITENTEKVESVTNIVSAAGLT